MPILQVVVVDNTMAASFRRSKSHSSYPMTFAKSSSPPRSLLAAGLVVTFALGLQAGESRASQCLVSDIVANSCPAGWNIVGDKQLSDLSFVGFTPGSLDEVVFQSVGTNLYQLQYNFNPIAGGSTATSGTFNYKITVTDASKFLTFAQANVTGGNLTGGTFTTTASSLTLAPPSSLTADSTNNPSPILAFNGGIQVAPFAQTFSTGAPGTINSFGLQFAQVIPPPSKAPGPLPLLGAGAAFGFTRRLRRRLRFAG